MSRHSPLIPALFLSEFAVDESTPFQRYRNLSRSGTLWCLLSAPR